MGLLHKVSGAQPADADLTAIAALTPSNDDVVQRKSGAWTNRTMAQLATDLSVAAATYPRHVVVPCFVAPIASSTTASVTSSSGNFYNGIVQAGTAVNNYMEWSVVVDAGTYTLRTLYAKNTNQAIITISIDGGADLGTSIDTYNATFSANQQSDITGIALTAGAHLVRFKAATKNGSSTNYAQALYGFSLTRTGA